MTPDQSDSEKARVEEARRVVLAYRAVFGREGQRTPAQELVWKNLRYLCYKDRTTMLPDTTGALCPLRTSQAEGQRVLFLQIEDIIRSASDADEKPAKPGVKR